MTNHNDQLEVIRFDDTKSFAENCIAFLTQIQTIDPEMATILHDNWATFLSIVHQGERDPKARVVFNANVSTALDSLIIQIRKEGSE